MIASLLGKINTTSVRLRIFRLSLSCGLLDQICRQWLEERRKFQYVFSGIFQQFRRILEAIRQLVYGTTVLRPYFVGIGLCKNRAIQHDHKIVYRFRNHGQQIFSKISAAALPSNSDKHFRQGHLEAFLVIGDDQLNTAAAPVQQSVKKPSPGRPGLRW
jgi:hypothetical protein